MTNIDPALTNGDSYSLQISTNSSLSCESDISSFSFDKEVANYTNQIDEDELPAFEIRLLSPLGRSPSPIDSDFEFLSSPNKSCITPTRSRKPPNTSKNNSEDFIPLHDINAQISPPSDSDSNSSSTDKQSICDSPLRGAGNLETIFEGVFLNTPPKSKIKQRKSFDGGVSANNLRNNLLERIAMNRMNFVPDSSSLSSGEKENVELMTTTTAMEKTSPITDDG